MTTTTDPDTRPSTFQFEVGRDAADVIAACQRRVEELGQYFGEGSKEHMRALQSWSRQLSRLIAMPMAKDTRVMKDGSALSLYVHGGIYFGIIFHADHRRCTNEGCDYYLHEDGTPYHYGLRSDARDCGDHVPSFPLDAPTPGEWSFHS